MTLAELRARLEAIFEELRAIDTEAGDTALTDEQNTAFDALVTERGEVEARIGAEERRAEQRDALARVPEQRREPGDGARRPVPEVIVRDDPFAVLEDRSLRGLALERALVDANLRAIEHRDVGGTDNEQHFERLIRQHGSDTRWAENILARQRPEYSSGFSKLITGRAMLMSDEERAALGVVTSTQGGALVPTHLDPSLMLTNAGSSNVMRQYARIVTLTEGYIWNGVTTAGVTASWDADLTEVSDDTPAVARVSITVNKPQSFIQASIEAFEDIAGLTSDVLMLFGDARDRLEGAGHMTGTGSSNQPKGLFTAINASASLQVTSTTAATIGEVDVHALYRAVPVRWRGRASFVANPLYLLAIKRLGTAVASSFSGDLTQPVSDRILGRPSVETDDAPTTQTTTALDQEVVFAPLAEYVIVDKPGSTSIEFVPHLFNTTTNLPDGRRGWYMYWRTGGDIPNVASSRILVDKTSA